MQTVRYNYVCSFQIFCWTKVKKKSLSCSCSKSPLTFQIPPEEICVDGWCQRRSSLFHVGGFSGLIGRNYRSVIRFRFLLLPNTHTIPSSTVILSVQSHMFFIYFSKTFLLFWLATGKVSTTRIDMPLTVFHLISIFQLFDPSILGSWNITTWGNNSCCWLLSLFAGCFHHFLSNIIIRWDQG